MTADLPVGFWAGWVVVITVVSMLGLCWLIYSIYFSKNTQQSAHETVWDETLREENNPAPLWWFWLIFALLIFSLVYLMLYPGLGSYRGILNWSQGSRLAESYEVYDQEFGPAREQILTASIEALAVDDRAMASSRRLFQRNCAACHGPQGSGQANLFPDLNDEEWQWGGTAEQIEQTIRRGRQAVMPGWQAVVGADGVNNLAEFVASLGTASAALADHPGTVQYATFCIACHGPTGKGNPVLGAPDLTNAQWLYGGSSEDIRLSIAVGRNGIMPAFDARLDDTQIRLLVAWLMKNQTDRLTSPKVADASD